jgi:hypothetical protein
MKSFVRTLAILSLVITAAPAAAQVATPQPQTPQSPQSPKSPRIEVYGGGTFLFLRPGADLGRIFQPGGQVSLNVSPFVDSDSWLRRLGFSVEGGGTRSTSTLDDTSVPSTKVRLTERTFLAGPTFSTMHFGRVTSQFRALFGVARLTSTFPTDIDQADIAPGQLPSSIGVFQDETAFATSIGSAWDIRLTRALALRINQGTLITRFDSKTQFSPRISTGIVFRWYGNQTQH